MADPNETRHRPGIPHETYWTHEPKRTPWHRRPRFLLLLIAFVSGGDDDTSTPAATRTSDSSPASRIGKDAQSSKRAHPFKGVTLTGSATELHLTSFKARTIAELFSPVVRVHNDSTRDLELVIVKVTALDGGDPIATANGVITRIKAGQTITVEPMSSDEWAKRSELTYDVQLDNE
jgi:hypothetical protein